MSDDLSISVILPAAGQSRRFGQGKRSKLEVELAGRAVLVRAVELFANRPEVNQILVAAPPDDLDAFKFRWADKLGFFGVKIVPGGRAERWETVARALGEVDATATHVAVHDAARPLTDAAAIDRVFAAAARFDAVVPAVPVSSTLKRTEASKADVTEEADPLDAILGSAGKETVDAWPIVETVRRDALWLAQTPQTFRRAVLEEAYARLGSGQIASDAVTDDAMLIEAMGRPVHVVEGDPLNVKITAPADLQLAEAILSMGRGQPARDALGPKRKFPTWAEADDE